MFVRLITLLTYLLVLSTAMPVIAEKKKVIALGIERFSGESRYEIGGGVCIPEGCGTIGYFPISKLQFPLDATLVTMGIEFPLSNGRIITEVKANPTTTQGTFIDSDYLSYRNDTPETDPNFLHVYSESRSIAKIFIVSVDYETNLNKTTEISTMFMGVGLTYQNFNFEASDTLQVSTIPRFNTGFNSGLSITYEVTHYIPNAYFRMTSDPTKDIIASFKFAYSPLVRVEDKDVHVRRNRVATGELDGASLKLDLALDFILDDSSQLQLHNAYMQIRAAGTQTQYDNGAFSATIDEETRSYQYSLAIVFRQEF